MKRKMWIASDNFGSSQTWPRQRMKNGIDDETSTSRRQKQSVLEFFDQKQILIKEEWLARIWPDVVINLGDQMGQEQVVIELVSRYFLASSLCDSMLTSPNARLPDNILSTKAGTIAGPVLVQLIQVMEIGFSVSQQLERLDTFEEDQKPVHRRLIRLEAEDVLGESDQPVVLPLSNSQMSQTSSHITSASDSDIASEKGMIGKKMCKLLLEDAMGTRVYALEAKPLKQIRVGTNLGSKFWITNVMVVEGVLMLKSVKVEWLGGQVEAWNINNNVKGLREELKLRLTEIAAENRSLGRQTSHNPETSEPYSPAEVSESTEPMPPPRRPYNRSKNTASRRVERGRGGRVGNNSGRASRGNRGRGPRTRGV